MFLKHGKGVMILVNLKEIARICGVSVATVSNVINDKHNVGEKTRKKVLDVVKQTGYQPNYFAQGMRKEKSKTIGIIVEDLCEFSTPPIVESVMAYCDDNNFRTVLLNMRLYEKWKDTWYDDQEKFQSILKPSIQELLSLKVEGIVYIAGHCRVVDCFPDDFETPAIVTYSLSKSSNFTSVIIDDKKGGYDVTKYLISMGHRKIAVIAGEADNLHTQNRIIGYQKALSEEEVLYDPSLVKYGDWKRESGYTNTAKLIKQDVNAIFCMNDTMAAGCYDYLYEHNLKIGEDVSVVGYDNKEISEYLRPSLTTNEINFSSIGNKATETLLKQIKIKNNYKTIEIEETIKIPCELVVRESVKNINI